MKKNPIQITIQINDAIIVSNNVKKKQNLNLHSGKGLQNLKEQYALLSKQKILITETSKQFTVILPIISNEFTYENSHY